MRSELSRVDYRVKTLQPVKCYKAHNFSQRYIDLEINKLIDWFVGIDVKL